MANNHEDDEIVVGINQSASKKRMDADLKKILSQINDLELTIRHGKLDSSTIRELQTQLDSLKTSVKVTDVSIDRQLAAKAGQQIGKHIEQEIETTLNPEISLDNIQNNLSTLKRSWKEQGILVDEFQSKVEKLEMTLTTLGKKQGQTIAKTHTPPPESSTAVKTEGSGKTIDTLGKSAVTTSNSISTLNSNWTNFVNILAAPSQSVSGITMLKNIVQWVNLVTSSYRKLGIVAGAVPLIISNQKNGGGLIRLVSQTDNSPFLATVECNSDVYDSYILL